MKPVGIHAYALCSSLGSNLTQTWDNLSQGNQQGMQFDSQYLNGESTYIGKINQNLPKLQEKFNHFDYRANRLLHFTFKQIKSQYDELTGNYPRHRIGIILGTSTAGVDSLESAIPYYDKHKKWPDSYLPHHQRMAGVSEYLAQYLGISHPVMSVSTACSSAAKAMLSAQRWINSDICDVVITGGVDVLCQLTLKGFNSLGALSPELSQPFSKNRQGINIGEAAAVFILKQEPAEINLLGGGESSDAHHISAPDPLAKGAITAMRLALKNTNVDARAIDYLNLHGTGTIQNDAMESLAVKAVFNHDLYCSSSKPLTGHTLGVAGALELGLCALSMSEDNKTGDYIPHFYDGAYDKNISRLNLVKAHNQLGRPQTIMSNSFAFGGSNAAVILARKFS
ncbi:3-oxoacyl-[ACP] synthase FabV like [hydrothermal vent metagenome]|uniref:3-oxoacyl-[ACP] synthase FabV like n=1 Tax=hydrothermal vent metagenome TaxID=652676 RepID=A0A3B0VQ91_9ZZZZ